MRNIESNGVKYLRTDATFNDFFNDHSNNIQIYRENYVPILIYFNNRGLELSNLGFSTLYYDFKYVEKPNIITGTENVIIEETTINGNKFIHKDRISYDNGVYKISNNIENENSTFMLNMINPIRINNKIIQFIRPNVSRHTKIPSVINYSSSFTQSIHEFLEVPVKTNGAPIKQKDGWLIEISSNYVILLSKYDIFLEKPDKSFGTTITQNNNPTFHFSKQNDGSFKFQLKFKYLVKSNITKVFLRNTNYFRKLLPNYDSFKIKNVPSDTNISNNLNNNWNNKLVKVKIPVTITAGTGGNYFVIENYPNINIFENSSLINQNLTIINSGVNSSNKTEVEVVTEPIEFQSSEFIWNEYTRSNKVSPTKYEPFPTVKNMINYVNYSKNNLSELSLQFILNRSKSWKEWTTVSFDNNIYYKNTDQLFNKDILIDQSQNITLIDNSNSVFIFEELNSTNSDFMTKIKLMSENNFTELTKLIEIRNTEILIIKYLDETIGNLNFWKDPIRNINLFLKYKNSRFTIIRGCLVDLQNESVDNTSLFTHNSDSTISRNNYLDHQIELSFNSSSNILKITRPKDKVIRAIKDLVNNINTRISYTKQNTYQPYFGVNCEKLFKDLSNIQHEYENFISRNLDSKNFNKEYKFLNLEKNSY